MGLSMGKEKGFAMRGGWTRRGGGGEGLVVEVIFWFFWERGGSCEGLGWFVRMARIE